MLASQVLCSVCCAGSLACLLAGIQACVVVLKHDFSHVQPAEAVAASLELNMSSFGGPQILHSPMTFETCLSAAPGLFFDIEATAADVIVSAIEIATEELEPVEFAGISVLL
jgi:hypothetical protein